MRNRCPRNWAGIHPELFTDTQVCCQPLLLTSHVDYRLFSAILFSLPSFSDWDWLDCRRGCLLYVCWVLMTVVIKPCPLLFVFFCSCFNRQGNAVLQTMHEVIKQVLPQFYWTSYKNSVDIIHIHLAATICGCAASFFVISASASHSSRLTFTLTLNLVKGQTGGRVF